MRNKLFILASALLFVNPSFAQSISKPLVSQTKVYRPFTYETTCALETKTEFLLDTCKVIETRETGGALRTRNIYSNRFGLTIKSRFDTEKGFVTWDSHNKYEYKWSYKLGEVDGSETWTYIMPGVLVKSVSWD